MIEEATSGLPDERLSETNLTDSRARKGRVRSAFASAILSRVFVPLVLAAAAAVRLTWMIIYPARPASDFNWYHEVGINIAQGHGIFYAGQPTATRPPGYPILLAFSNVISGNSLLVNRLLTAAFGMGTIWLAYLIARRLFHSEMTGRLTLLLLAFFPNQIAYGGLLASELPFSFFILLGAWILIARPRTIWTFAAAGSAFGVAALIRPVAVILPVVIGIAAFRHAGWKTFLRGMLVGYLILVAFLAPWFIRNHAAFGRAAFSTNEGESLLEGTFPPMKTSRAVLARSKKLVPPVANAAVDDANREAYALHYIRTHWVVMARLVPHKFYQLNWKDSDAISWTISGLHFQHVSSLRTWQKIDDDYYLAVVALALAGVCLVFNRRIRRAHFSWLPFSIWIVSIVFYLPFASLPRYHAPLVPWITMYAGAFGAYLIGHAYDRSPSEQPAPTLD
jgi:4-amino-4-deoxy-L-arabinose transferase-like glycosyltransferase